MIAHVTVHVQLLYDTSYQGISNIQSVLSMHLLLSRILWRALIPKAF